MKNKPLQLGGLFKKLLQFVSAAPPDFPFFGGSISSRWSAKRWRAQVPAHAACFRGRFYAKCRIMFKVRWYAVAIMAAGAASLASAQTSQTLSVDVANLREDVRMLTQRVGELQLRVEQLERENGELQRTKNASSAENYATVTQLNEAIAELNRSIKTASATTKNETLQQVSGQMEKLAKQTNAALESLAKASAANRSPVVAAPTFSDDYPKEGVKYTVQKGDTMAVIAKKTGGSVKDIINANKIADPSKIMIGQTLFIPGGK
jgi:LysM repeat protein